MAPSENIKFRPPYRLSDRVRARELKRKGRIVK
jgi:hypothetical protein